MGEIDGGFKSCKRQKMFVCQVIVRNDDFMIGESDDGITVIRKDALDFLGRQFSVRDRGVHMQVGFIKLPACGKEFLAHGLFLYAVPRVFYFFLPSSLSAPSRKYSAVEPLTTRSFASSGENQCASSISSLSTISPSSAVTMKLSISTSFAS